MKKHGPNYTQLHANYTPVLGNKHTESIVSGPDLAIATEFRTGFGRKPAPDQPHTAKSGGDREDATPNLTQLATIPKVDPGGRAGGWGEGRRQV